MSKLIVVACHQDLNLEKLEDPYIEVYRTDSPQEFEHNIYQLEGIKSPIVSWSEYGQFFHPFPLDENIDTFGLVHYRCMLDLEDKEEYSYILPYAERKNFYEKQVPLLDRFYGNIIVGEPLEFECSTWDQFSNPFPDIEKTFLLACKKFDMIVGDVDSEYILKSTHKLYSRNIFIAPASVAKGWYEISREIVKYLDTVAPHGTDPRWGGYILERLFSVYISLIILNVPNLVVTRPLIFFE